MKYVAILAISTVLFLAGCEYKVPLTEEHMISIDSMVLGLWESIPDQRSGPDPNEQMLILKFSETEYLIHYPMGKEGLYFRAYPITIGKVSCVQFQVIGTADEPLDENEKDVTLFHVISYFLAGDELVVKVLNTKLVNKYLETSEALRNAFLKHQDNKDLFTDPGIFRRVNAGDNKAIASTPRIGIYDSRAIAVAFVGSEVFKQTMSDLQKRLDEAEAVGDKEMIAKLEAEDATQQKMLHKQGFSTASVENILKHIASQLSEIKKQAQIDMIVSKWNTEALAKYESAEQVDVTMLLVEAFKPNDKQKKSALEIQKHDPIPLKKMNNHNH